MPLNELRKYVLENQENEKAWKEFVNHPRPNATTIVSVQTPLEEQKRIQTSWKIMNWGSSPKLDNLPDERKPSNNTKYAVEEALLSAFSLFFMQSNSFLDHQRLMKSQKGKDNLASLFGIEYSGFLGSGIRKMLVAMLADSKIN